MRMPVFEPSSIAVVGASASEHKVGHMVLRNLVQQGYEGAIYPINPKGGEILGKKVYENISDVPSEVEMAVVVTPAPTVCAVAKECGEKGVKWLVVITAGFSEVHTEEGKKMENDLVAVCAEYRMNLVGPNCLGVLRPSIKMNASFAKDISADGCIALVSQSGAMAVAIMDASPSLHLGYSLVLSIGNKAAMDACDYLELCEQDDKTKVIGLYLENIADGARFLEVAARVARTKHIVLLKSGVSKHGKEAASSHTGALAGSDSAIDAACIRTGVHRAHTFQDFMNLLQTLSTQPPLLSRNVVVITNAGGPGILATDGAETAGLLMPHLSEATLTKLKPHLPEAAGLVNPIDVIGDATTERYQAALDICNEDPNVDGMVVLLTPQVMTPCTEIANAVVQVRKQSRLMPIVTSFMGGESVKEAIDILAANGIPNFQSPERAMYAMSTLLRKDPNRKDAMPISNEARAKKATAIIGKCKGLLSEDATKELLALYDIPLPLQGLATNVTEARNIAQEIGYPVIAKISSPQILHKTDVGGIKANLKNDDDVSRAFEEIITNVEAKMPEAERRGVLIQKFLPIGNEFIVGGLRDPSFGPMVMVGLGGIYTELFRDTSFRMAPITSEEGYRMLQDLKSWNLLLGMRGQRQSDIDGVVETLVAVSSLMNECPQISELDFNPILVSADGVIVADSKVVVTEKKG
ncbi:acyl-CoA synthetase [Candidatus Peregrinibacteria bacterium CG10_big_fil_rev_8_21_14_0_10_49_24]|nr:MAG: acyl-CoA synthetase [Candidatus Peregrinibacteria bacterium CG11_big_fil_rev_8_21_14_0_20_49_14]PIR51600.1 MAG: acyl-CoA synthetase [Candidatus Peregrinibacteria bacterium CG10_big_fil_rev_8_21_14_0_10_49_24]PJA68039.1 MAG: acyl-CoA synthetase [Candidatus Peregrinibacteria bacterium CG_4_9_14_3_um_filter_49_12]